MFLCRSHGRERKLIKEFINIIHSRLSAHDPRVPSPLGKKKREHFDILGARRSLSARHNIELTSQKIETPCAHKRAHTRYSRPSSPWMKRRAGYAVHMHAHYRPLSIVTNSHVSMWRRGGDNADTVIATASRPQHQLAQFYNSRCSPRFRPYSTRARRESRRARVRAN